MTIREASIKLAPLITAHRSRDDLILPIQNPILICTSATHIINYSSCESVWVSYDREHSHLLILATIFTFSSLSSSFPEDTFVPRNSTLGMNDIEKTGMWWKSSDNHYVFLNSAAFECFIYMAVKTERHLAEFLEIASVCLFVCFTYIYWFNKRELLNIQSWT